MALLLGQIPRWLNSVKPSSFIKASRITKQPARPGKTLSNVVSPLALWSSDNRFLQLGVKTYRTSSLWNSFQSANSSRQEGSSSQTTVLPAVSEKLEMTPSLESELLLEELEDSPPLSPMQPVSEKEAIWIAAHPLLPLSSSTLGDYIDHSETLQRLVQLVSSRFPTGHELTV